MSQSREINFRVNIDSSQVPKQAEQSAKAIRTELDKQKAAVDKIMNDLLTSGGKIKVPMEDFKAAVNSTTAALDKMGEDNAKMLNMLFPKYDELKAKMQAAWNSGDSAKFSSTQRQVQDLEREIALRQRLDKEIRSQSNALDQLNGKVEQSANSSKKTEQSAQALSQKLAELKKRMSELAAAGQQNSKEYQECSAKAKELSNAIQKLNADAKPNALMSLNSELEKAKQEMSQAKDKFGEGSVQFQQTRDKAVQLQQAMAGINKQVKTMAAPTATFQGLITAMNGISGAASAATGMMTLFGGESQQTAKAMAKLQAIMSITMGLQSMSMMLNKDNALQLNIIGRLTSWWAACKAKAAAATAAETGAVVANTTAQTVQATAVTAGTTANVAHAASWKAVGIAIKSVPVFGWIVAGIMAIVAAVSALSSLLHGVSKETRWLGEVTKEANAEYIKEQRVLDSVYRAATNANKPLEERRVALQKLREQYPDYFRDLTDEAILAGQAADEYKRLSDNLRKAAMSRAMENAMTKTMENIANWETDNLDAAQFLNNPEYQSEFAEFDKNPRVQSAINKLANLYNALPGFMDNAIEEGIDRANMSLLNSYEGEEKQERLKQYIKYKAKQKGDTKDDYEKIEYLQAQIDSGRFTSELTGDAKAEQTEGTRQYYERIIRENQAIVNQGSAIADELDAAGNVIKTGAQRISEAKANIRKAQQMLKTFDITDNSNAAGAADVASQKIDDIEDKNNREREKAAYQRQMELEQLKIEAMAEGSEKRLAQMRLDNKKEESQLDQQLNDAIAAEVERQRKEWDATEAANEKAATAAKTSYKRKPFSAGNILRQTYSPESGDVTKIDGIDKGNVNTDSINDIISGYRAMSDEMAKIHEEQLREFAFAELQSLRDYLTAYGSAKEQEIAITQEYDRKIAATNDKIQIKSLERERDQKIAKSYADDVSNRASLIPRIDDFGGLFRDVMTAAADELSRYMQTDKFKNLDKNTRQSMQEQYTEMRQRLGDAGGLDFSKLREQVKNYESAMKGYSDAQKEHERSVRELDVAQKNYQKVLEDDNATDTAREAAKAALETATEQADKTREAMEEAEGVAKQAGNTAGATASELKKNMDKVTSGLQQLSSGSLASAYQGLIQFGKGAGGLMGEIAKKLEDTPIAGWVLSILDVLRDGMAQLIVSLIDAVIGATGNIISEALSGKLITNVLESLWHGTIGMWRGIGDSIGGLFGKSNEKEVAELTEKLTESNERLRDAVDGLKNEISESGGWRAITAAQQARDDQQKIIDQTAVILEAQMRKHGSHSSNAKNWDLNDLEYASLNATLADFQRRFGGELKQVFSLEDILELTPEQMDYIRRYNVELWQRMTSIGKYDVTDAWDDYADLAGAMDEIQKTLKETMTQISFDSMRDSFLSDLMQMDKKASEFGDNLREYLMKAVLNAKLSDLLDEDLQEFYDKWAEYMESDNELDDREIAELQALYDDIVSRGLEIRDQAAAITGYDKTASNSGSGTTGTFATASQDSITELSGRAAAIHTSGEVRRELLLNIGVDVAELKAQAAASAADSAEMRELQLIAVEHLETIARNTSELYEMNERLDKIERNTRGL